METATKQPFTAVYQAWAQAWADNRFTTKEILILIALAQFTYEDEQGRKYAWRSRAELAKAAGCSESGVKTAITRLKGTDPNRGRNIRGLELKSSGHKGRASEYYIMPDTPIAPDTTSRKRKKAERKSAGVGKPRPAHKKQEPQRNVTPQELLSLARKGKSRSDS